MENIVFTLAGKVIRRVLEAPRRGLPRIYDGDDGFDGPTGAETAGISWLTNLRSKNFAHGIRYEPCSTASCRWAIEHAAIDPQQFWFVDVGCGKGKPILIAAQYGFAQLVGVEYSSRLCKVAERNFERCGVTARIVCQDAEEFQFPAADVFAYFFHPFTAPVLTKVLDHLRRDSRRVVVAYENNGEGRDSVLNHGWLQSICKGENVELFCNFYMKSQTTIAASPVSRF